MLRREFQTPKVIAWNTTENVDNIDLRLVDYQGNLLPIEPTSVIVPDGLLNIQVINNTADFQFTIMATEQ